MPRTLEVSSTNVGRIIGKGGQNINRIRTETNTTIHVGEDQPNCTGKANIVINGSAINVAKAIALLNETVQQKNMNIKQNERKREQPSYSPKSKPPGGAWGKAQIQEATSGAMNEPIVGTESSSGKVISAIQKWLVELCRPLSVICEFDPICAGYFVKERLTYKPRTGLHVQIVNAFFTRNIERQKSTVDEALDKRINALVVVPGTPGSGKSTTLRHFPASEEYRNYCKEAGSHMPPIVALVSFNSAMSGGPACFGLRIIFGALKCMGILDATSTWVEFCAIHMNHARGSSAIQAVKLLRMVLGHDRRVLVCVDELSKAEFAAEDLPAMSRPDKTAEVAIMTELARLLEQDGKCDIVVSTPSPQYIDELTYGSNRPIIYLPVEPLQGTVAEYSRAAEVLIQNCARGLAGKRNPVFKLRMLRSGYLLASGHPRTIEGLVDNLEKSTNFSQTITKALCDEGVTSSDFLEEMFACPCFQITLAASTSEELQCVLSDEESMFTAKEYRYYLERPLVHIHSATYKGFRVTTTLSAFFSAVRWAENCVKGAAAAQPPPRNVQFLTTIFSYVLDKNRKPGKSALPEMWERSRALNVAMFALSRSKCTFCRLSGKAVRSRTMSVELTDVRIATAAITYHNGVLFVADEGQSGFDFLVCGVDEGGKPAYLYEEVKLYESKPLLDIIAEKIQVTLADHWASRAPPTTVIEADEFQRIAFVLSRYADATSEENTSLQSYQAVLQNMQTKLDTESDAQKRQDWERAMRYVQQPEVWEMNVGFLFKEELEATMIPVTLTIAKLALKVQDEVK